MSVNKQSTSKPGHREEWIALVICAVVAFLYISGLPGVLIFKLQLADLSSETMAFFINLLLVLVLGLALCRLLIPDFDLGLRRASFVQGLRRYAVPPVLASLILLIGYAVILWPFDLRPSFGKVLFELVIYNVGVGLIEEFFCRGLLQNAIEGMFCKAQHRAPIAVILAAVIFGLGHFFGMIGMPALLTASKISSAVGIGIYLGMVYIRTRNLWLAAFFHFAINLGALPFHFSSQIADPPTAVSILLLLVGLALGLCGLAELSRRKPSDQSLTML